MGARVSVGAPGARPRGHAVWQPGPGRRWWGPCWWEQRSQCASASNMQGCLRKGRGVVGSCWSVPVALRPPPQSGTVRGLALPTRVPGGVQGRQVALEGPWGGAQGREMGGLNSRVPRTRLPGWV